MEFAFVPIIDTMIVFYEKPRNSERFKDYLKILQGSTKEDLELPIGNSNPMGKDHVYQKLVELKALDVEKILEETLVELNKRLPKTPDTVFKIVLNLSDDLKGGWTNRYTTDYDSKFGSNALLKRNFCTPIFWTSETYDKEMARHRTMEYAFRTVYRTAHSKPQTLKKHIEQEIFVARNANEEKRVRPINFDELNSFYLKHQDSENYSLNFNFMYGDKISESLAFPTYGVKDKMAGFKLAYHLN